MRLIAYLRVSTIGQAEDGLGLPVQEKLIRAWCKANGHQLVRAESDNGKSGTLPDAERPGLLAVLKAIDAGEADGVVISSMDRLARLLHVQEAILGKVWQSGGHLYSVDSGEVTADDPDDPMRTAMRQMAGVFAQLDRAMIAKRLRNGRAEKAHRGGFAYGSPPFGWRAEGHELVPVESEQAALRRIRELRAAGESIRAIGETLAAEGHAPKRGGQWHAETIRRILRSDDERQAEAARARKTKARAETVQASRKA